MKIPTKTTSIIVAAAAFIMAGHASLAETEIRNVPGTSWVYSIRTDEWSGKKHYEIRTVNGNNEFLEISCSNNKVDYIVVNFNWIMFANNPRVQTIVDGVEVKWKRAGKTPYLAYGYAWIHGYKKAAERVRELYGKQSFTVRIISRPFGREHTRAAHFELDGFTAAIDMLADNCSELR